MLPSVTAGPALSGLAARWRAGSIRPASWAGKPPRDPAVEGSSARTHRSHLQAQLVGLAPPWTLADRLG